MFLLIHIVFVHAVFSMKIPNKKTDKSPKFIYPELQPDGNLNQTFLKSFSFGHWERVKESELKIVFKFAFGEKQKDLSVNMVSYMNNGLTLKGNYSNTFEGKYKENKEYKKEAILAARNFTEPDQDLLIALELSPSGTSEKARFKTNTRIADEE